VSELYRDANWFHRTMRRVAGTRPVSWFFARTLMPTDRLVYRLTKGRSTFATQAAGLPVVMLTTTGARTGQARSAPVLGIEDGEAVIVIGTNYAQERTPAWAYNLRANPEAGVALGGTERRLAAREVVEEAEREACWSKGAAVYPGFLRYRSRLSRTTPIFRLEPERSTAAQPA
jgi:deazaflavin-dependent oxidoreductase (nitroreductase family)